MNEITQATPYFSTNTRKIPGSLAIWAAILAEMSEFAIMFMVYFLAKVHNPDVFYQGPEKLSTLAGTANTLLMLSSSFFVVRAIHAIRNDNAKACVTWLYASLACGAGFLLLKTVEYYDKFSQGINLSTNTFYMFYLSLTMFHFLHVILGMIILFFITIKAQRGKYNAQNHIGIETGASYWHMVDLAWIILFPLVYIIR